MLPAQLPLLVVSVGSEGPSKRPGVNMGLSPLERVFGPGGHLVAITKELIQLKWESGHVGCFRGEKTQRALG